MKTPNDYKKEAKLILQEWAYRVMVLEMTPERLEETKKLGVPIAFSSQELENFIESMVKEILDSVALEEKDMGGETHCKTCAGHIAAGECDCSGHNKAVAEQRKLHEEVLE